MAHAHYDPLSFPGPIGNREGGGARGRGLWARGVKQPFWVDLIVKVDVYIYTVHVCSHACICVPICGCKRLNFLYI